MIHIYIYIFFLVPAVKKKKSYNCFLSEEMISMHILDSNGLFLKGINFFYWLET